MKKLMNISRKLRRERGSALLVSLMVMVGLSLLGLGFVAVTETESAIAVNERNSAQALFAAETGARAVVDFFQDSTWAKERGLLPANLTAFKTRRVFTHNTDMNGYYKANALMNLFDKPFKGADYGNKFYGDGDLNPPTADVWIYIGKNTASDNYLNTLNTALFVPDPAHGESVRISDIRVYAPPMPGDTRNVNGFWINSQPRYGVATIRVTAQKLARGNVVAERTVKAVVAETPFPTVDGAIETSGTLVGQGSFEVYWGKVLSEKDIELKRAVAGMPWVDAKNVMNFEYGWDSAAPRLPSTLYDEDAVVMAPATALASDPQLLKFSYVNTTVDGGTTEPAGSSPADTDWPKVIDGTLNDGTVVWRARQAVSFPKDADFYHSQDWFYQLLGRNIPDPWLHARARLGIQAPNDPPCNQATAPHPCDYDAASDPVQSHFSNMFQFQTTTESGDRPERVEAVFPTMDYEFWKNVALSGNNENGVYYFKYATPITGNHNEFIGPGGQRRHVIFWLNAIANGRGAGFYFFDTKNAKNPQFNKGGILTPQIDLNSGSINSYTTAPFQMQGYIYLNSEWFGTSGLGSTEPTDYYPMPGEPFRDVGFREVDETPTAPGPYYHRIVGGALPAGDYVWVGRNNEVWDFQDVNKNAKFDLFLREVTTAITRPDGSTVNNIWVPVPFFDGCVPGDTLDAGANCSEPHEPYLNMTYTAAFSGSNPTTGVTTEWYDPNITSNATILQYRKPKRRTGMNQTVTCTTTSSASDCTSNYYDQDGGLAQLEAILWGALYSEGGYQGSGNAVYYGALLMRAAFNATGTPTVYFNECLARGCLEDQLNLQRVTVTSWETD